MSGFDQDDFDKTIEISRTAIVRLGDVEEDTKSEPVLLVIQGPNIGRQYKIESEVLVLGRSQDADVVIVDDGISRQHARILMQGQDFVVEDLESTNGVYINGHKTRKSFLESGDKIRLGSNTVLKFTLQDAVEEGFQRQMYDSAVRDTLTGLYNKRYFRDSIKTEFAYYSRHGLPLSVVMSDIDFFKKVNDTFGHPAGDHVLKEVARLITAALRTEDIPCRYGGEEFAIILRNTDIRAAIGVCERIRKSVADFVFKYDQKIIPVTLSLGIATLVDDSFDNPRALIEAADKFLYAAKRGGRNRTACARKDKPKS